jgi:cysteine desulfurase
LNKQSQKPVYLDCNATTPIEPEVRDAVIRFMTEEFGNAGSRTHEYGTTAKRAVQRAREQVAGMVQSNVDEIVFTSGATESNNLAILGLARHGHQTGRKHIVSTLIEHKAVLEPLEFLAKDGFEITLLRPTKDGCVDPSAIQDAMRKDTLLVSVMQANNETGVIQPISEILTVLADHPAYFHVDAAQGFGKLPESLHNKRIDLISISGHKIFGPKGVGALVVRRRDFNRLPLTPLFYGGGQERGLRPGTLPVSLIVGLGVASELAMRRVDERNKACREYRRKVLEGLVPVSPIFNGDPELTLPHVINVYFPGVDSEALMVAVKDYIAISNGSACTSQSYKPSHVLKAMGIPDRTIKGAVRISWCHLTAEADWNRVVSTIRRLT